MADEATTTTDTTQAGATTTEGAAATTDTGKTTATTTTDAGAAEAAKTAEAEKGKTEAGKEADKTADTKAEPVDYGKVIAETPMPEGYTLDPALAKAGGELMAKHNIPAEAVKDLAGFFAQQQKAGADGNAKAFADQVKTWGVEAEKTTTPEERGAAKEAALKIFGKDEVALLETFGVTNRAGFIKACARVASAIKDDRFVRGDAGASDAAPDARKHFPNSNMNP